MGKFDVYMEKRKVYHVNQKVVEHYIFHHLHGWVFVPRQEADDWRPSEFDYIELVHNDEPNKYGLYGSHILWW